MFAKVSTGIAVSLLMLAGTIAASHAQQKPTGGPSPSAPGAAVYFVGLKDGQTVPTTFTVNFGLKGMGVAPAGSDKENSGHHHLIIDAELPMIPLYYIKNQYLFRDNVHGINTSPRMMTFFKGISVDRTAPKR